MLMSMYVTYIPFRKELFQIDGGHATTKDAAAAKAEQGNKDADAEAKKKRPDIEIWRSLPCMTKKAKIPFERVKSIIGENGKLHHIVLFTIIFITTACFRQKRVSSFLSRYLGN